MSKIGKATVCIVLLAFITALASVSTGIRTAYAASSLLGTVVNCSTSVNVRSGPGTKYSILGAAKKGSAYTVLSSALFNGSWYKIDYKGKTGYISDKYLRVSVTDPSVEKVVMGTVVKCSVSVIVRTGASARYPKLGSAAKGSRYAVLGTSGSWYKVLFNGKTGYISKSYLSVSREITSQQADITLKAASFNVQNLKNGANAASVAALIKASKADIVGLQEIDRFMKRSGNTDWPARLAALSGYAYYCFAPTVSYGGGLYGTLILSRYPIIEARVILLDTAAGVEARALAYARVLTGKGAVCMFNTHLSYESTEAVQTSLASLNAKLSTSGCKKYLVTGDFNTSPDVISRYVNGLTIANTKLPTFLKKSAWIILDNLLYTSGVTVSGLTVKDAISGKVSDHNLLLATVTVQK